MPVAHGNLPGGVIFLLTVLTNGSTGCSILRTYVTAGGARIETGQSRELRPPQQRPVQASDRPPIQDGFLFPIQRVVATGDSEPKVTIQKRDKLFDSTDEPSDSVSKLADALDEENEDGDPRTASENLTAQIQSEIATLEVVLFERSQPEKALSERFSKITSRTKRLIKKVLELRVILKKICISNPADRTCIDLCMSRPDSKWCQPRSEPPPIVKSNPNNS